MKQYILYVLLLSYVLTFSSCRLWEVVVGNTATIVVQHRVDEFPINSTTRGKVEDIKVTIDGERKILDSPTSRDTNPVREELWEVTWYGLSKDFDMTYTYEYYEITSSGTKSHKSQTPTP